MVRSSHISVLVSLVTCSAKPTETFGFSSTLSDYVVLQQAPSQAAVYGITGQLSSENTVPEVQVTVTDDASGESYVSKAQVTAEGEWKALLHPHKDGGSFTIVASCDGCADSTDATIHNATFGDVWYCSGQSNMWLPMFYTFARNESMSNILNGKYENIRMMAGDSQKVATTAPWRTAKGAATDGDCSIVDHGTGCSLLNFAGVCYYFAESLTDQMRAAGLTPPTIGLVSTAVGGSMIEEWVPNSTNSECQGAHNADHNQLLWDQNVRPFLNMSVKGWLWYQGENNMHDVMGNSQDGVGYGCQLPSLVKTWREHWSATPGTTDPMAPFGVVTLAAGGDEGGKDMGGMRWSQTANFGVLPNPAMPNTFLAQGFDAGDPWDALNHCVKQTGCCGRFGTTYTPRNMTSCPDDSKGWADCKAYCTGQYSSSKTAPFMGGIHPRNKKIIGERLAKACLPIVYGGKGPYTGPTLASCAIDSSDKTRLTVRFNQSLLAGDAVEVQPYGQPTTDKAAMTSSTLRVLVDAKYWCSKTVMRCAKDEKPCTAYEWFCEDDGAPNDGQCGSGLECGKGPLQTASSSASMPEPWIEVDILAGANANEVVIDLTKLNGSQPLALHYGWASDHATCCVDGNEHNPCVPGSCPLMGKTSRLPANPFIAQLVDGRCSCIPPQKCDGEDAAIALV